MTRYDQFWVCLNRQDFSVNTAQLMANDPSLVPGPFSERFIFWTFDISLGKSHSDNSQGFFILNILNSCSQMFRKCFAKFYENPASTPVCTPRASESLQFVGPSRAKDHRSQKMKPATGIQMDLIYIYIYVYVYIYT